jgi:NADPH-dependent 2,4-dienoyl-CoA reductase/sulfur reductase-like enzyme
MAAAIRASESGATVLVLDDNPTPGGQIWRGGEKTNSWLRRFAKLREFTIHNCRVTAASTNPLQLLVESDAGAWNVSPSKLVLATGARELFLPFPGWTLPGVMGVGGLQSMVKSGLPIADNRIVVAGTGPLLLAVAAYLTRRLAKVVLIAEQAPTAKLLRFAATLGRYPEKLLQAALLKFDLGKTPYLRDCWVEEALGTTRVETVRVRRGNRTFEMKCDYLAVAYGLSANTELLGLLSDSSLPDVYVAGGAGGVDLSIVEGEIAGYAAAGNLEKAGKLSKRRARAQAFASALESAFVLRDELKALPRRDTIVCRCEDVTFARLQSIGSFRAAKLHTRCGMGPCQGRVCGPATEFFFGWRTDSIRPPVLPARLGTLAVWNGKE